MSVAVRFSASLSPIKWLRVSSALAPGGNEDSQLPRIPVLALSFVVLALSYEVLAAVPATSSFDASRSGMGMRPLDHRYSSNGWGPWMWMRYRGSARKNNFSLCLRCDAWDWTGVSPSRFTCSVGKYHPCLRRSPRNNDISSLSTRHD